MNRSMALAVIVVGLAGYGVYIATYLPAMLVVPPAPVLLLIGFILQVVFALAAAVGTWRGQSWTGAALVLLGASIAATWLVEAFVYGFVAYGRAVLVAVLAILITWALAVYINRQARPQLA